MCVSQRCIANSYKAKNPVSLPPSMTFELICAPNLPSCPYFAHNTYPTPAAAISDINTITNIVPPPIPDDAADPVEDEPHPGRGGWDRVNWMSVRTWFQQCLPLAPLHMWHVMTCLVWLIVHSPDGPTRHRIHCLGLRFGRRSRHQPCLFGITWVGAEV